MIVKTAYDLMPYLDAIDKIKASSLTKDEKAQILEEMKHSFIDIVFCRQCPNTHAIILKRLGEANGSTKEPTKEVAKKGTEVSKKGGSKSKQLLHDTNANGRGKSTKKTVVNQKT
mgnify:CR=1 FL=1